MNLDIDYIGGYYREEKDPGKLVFYDKFKVHCNQIQRQVASKTSRVLDQRFNVALEGSKVAIYSLFKIIEKTHSD